jgi:hypothetical protein
MCVDLVKYPLFLSDFNETWICSTDFRKCWNLKFHENPSSGSRIVSWGQTDGQTGTYSEADGLFHNFANVPKTSPLWRPSGWNRHSFIRCDFAQWYWSPCSSSLSSCIQRYVYPFKFYELLLLAFVLPRIDLDLNLHINLPPFVCRVPHVRIHNCHYTTMA